MHPAHNFDDKTPAPDLSTISTIASGLGFEIVDIAGFLDEIDRQTHEQMASMVVVRASAGKVKIANTKVRESILNIIKTTGAMVTDVQHSVDEVRSSGKKSQEVAEWVQDIDARMTAVEETLRGVQANNDEIASIANQVNILAINAKIEAARAGSAGRGFAVVAEAINELSQKTASAAGGIADNITSLSGWIVTLKDEASTVSGTAAGVITGAKETDDALVDFLQNVQNTHEQAEEISIFAEEVRQARKEFEPGFDQISKAFEQTAGGIHSTRDRVHALIDKSEEIVRACVETGTATEDDTFIEYVQNAARQISERFERAIELGEITEQALFDNSYTDIPHTNPKQMMTPFVNFTDRVLPEIQEAAAQLSENVVFCAAVTRDAFLPTHNEKFSQPQSRDPVWNAAHCRNRIIWNDRVGTKAATNRDPFLLQMYRRDMGGGTFAMMKDLSAPIFVNGHHWGGLRFAYKI